MASRPRRWPNARRRAASACRTGSDARRREVEAELRTYQRLFQEDEQQARRQHLLRIAARLMSTVQRFNPYLSGSVLDGTAGRYAEIDIQLFPIAPRMSRSSCSTSASATATAAAYRSRRGGADPAH
jgi:hypothetical protein